MTESLVSKLQRQIQFYFSDANLRHDKFLRRHISEASDNYVDLEVIARCNMVKSLTEDIDDIRQAIRSCSDLELSADGQKVRRISNLPEHINTDEQTIFVDSVPPFANHAMIKGVFSQFGTVEYVSLPRYQSTGNLKGFAFVEFDSKESAIRAVKAFDRGSSLEQEAKSGCPSESSEPSGERQPTKKRRKRKRPLSSEFGRGTDSSEPVNKMPVLESQGLEVHTNSAADQSSEAVRTLKKEMNNDEGRTESHGSPQVKCSIDVQKLRVISKKEWRTLKQLYLKLQREHMGHMKQQMRDSQLEKRPSTSVDEIASGSIIRIEGNLDGFTPKTLRGLFDSVRPVAYVDINPEETKGYVRFVSRQGASLAIRRCQQKTLPPSLQELRLSPVEWEEEQSYIQRARQHRQVRLSGPSKEKRGRDKWLAKAETFTESQKESVPLHIRFDDSSGEEESASATDCVKTSASSSGECVDPSASSSGNKQKRGRKRKKSASGNGTGTA